MNGIGEVIFVGLKTIITAYIRDYMSNYIIDMCIWVYVHVLELFISCIGYLKEVGLHLCIMHLEYNIAYNAAISYRGGEGRDF